MASTTEFQPVSATHLPTPAPLEETSDPKSTINYLRSELGLTLRDLSHLTGAEERTIRRWDQNGKVQQRYAERIDDLRHLVLLLSDTLPGVQAARWLKARNRTLKGQRPIELLAAGNYNRVLDAAEIYVIGDPL